MTVRSGHILGGYWGTMGKVLLRAGLAGSVCMFVVAAASAQELPGDQPPPGLVGGTLGGAVFALPGFTAPPVTNLGTVISDTFNILAPGGVVAVGGSFETGVVGDYTGGINLSGFGAYAVGSASNAQTLSGDGVLYIPGITTPAGTITLLTDDTAPTATSTVAGTSSNQTATTPANGGGAVNLWNASQGGAPNEFSLIGAATYNGAPANAAMAFGAIANGTGGAFLASGDLTGVVLTTSTAVDVIYAGGDLSYGLSGTIGSNTYGTVYAGPSIRFLDQKFVTDISVDMAELTPLANSLQYPTYTQTTDEHLSATYLGGVIGAGISTPLGGNWSLSVNGEGGLYWANATLDASEAYTLSGGDNGAGVPAITQTVNNATAISDSDSRLAYAARLQAVLTTAVSQNQQIHFGGNAEYLSAVPTITRAAADYPVTTPSAGDATYTGASTGGTPSIAFAGMFNFGATVSLTGQF